MSLDVFGRSSNQSVKSSRGPPGVGFIVTTDGHFDIENKKLCNVAEASEENDAVNLKLLENSLEREAEENYKNHAILRQQINDTIHMIRSLEYKTNKEFLTRFEKDYLELQNLVQLNSTIISQLDKRLITLEKK